MDHGGEIGRRSQKLRSMYIRYVHIRSTYIGTPVEQRTEQAETKQKLRQIQGVASSCAQPPSSRGVTSCLSCLSQPSAATASQPSHRVAGLTGAALHTLYSTSPYVPRYIPSCVCTPYLLGCRHLAPGLQLAPAARVRRQRGRGI